VEESESIPFKISDRTEDYLRCVYKIIEQQGIAKTGDIALELNIKPASVFEMLNKLQKLSLILHEKCGEVKLTKKGLSIAKAITKRHDTFREFLEIILVPHEIAIRDANILEHKLDYKTILQFTKFVDFMTLERPGLIRRWIESFKGYCDREQLLKRSKGGGLPR
jgi:DtxR family transcriptional regulator, Mn-dependent transcriptional regulator